MQSEDTPLITNREVARVLFQTGALLEMVEANPYRVRAYRRAALGILFLPKPVAAYVFGNEQMPLRGVGDGMQQKVADLVNTGHMESHELLIEELGEPLASLLLVQGVGPRTAVRLVSELQVGTLQDLAKAANEGKIRELRGFGPKREARIAVTIFCSPVLIHI
jgi:DNA polymerase (family 10)